MIDGNYYVMKLARFATSSPVVGSPVFGVPEREEPIIQKYKAEVDGR